jgi:hypothetical protein
MVKVKDVNAHFHRKREETGEWKLVDNWYSFNLPDTNVDAQSWYLKYKEDKEDISITGHIYGKCFSLIDEDTQGKAKVMDVTISSMRLSRLLTPWHYTGFYYVEWDMPSCFLAELESALGDKVYLEMDTLGVKRTAEDVRLTLIAPDNEDFNIKEWIDIYPNEMYKGLDIQLCLDYLHATQDFILEYMA